MADYRLKKIIIEWNEGTADFDNAEFDNWADYEAALIQIGAPDLGYNKVKTQFWVENDETGETPLIIRIDVGTAAGDFRPGTDRAKEYVNSLSNVDTIDFPSDPQVKHEDTSKKFLELEAMLEYVKVVTGKDDISFQDGIELNLTLKDVINKMTNKA